jgi:hypothetical protein
MAAFPTTWDDHISDETRFSYHDNVARDLLDDGTVITRVLGPTRVRVNAIFRNLDATQSNALLSFLQTNRSGQIEWALDSKNYEGVLMTGPELERQASLHHISFEFHGIIV